MKLNPTEDFVASHVVMIAKILSLLDHSSEMQNYIYYYLNILWLEKFNDPYLKLLFFILSVFTSINHTLENSFTTQKFMTHPELFSLQLQSNCLSR
jgi:hypothetical protein